MSDPNYEEEENTFGPQASDPEGPRPKETEPEEEPKDADQSEIESREQFLSHIYNLMLDEREEDAANSLQRYVAEFQSEAFAEAKKSCEDYVADELQRFQETHICLPATANVVSYVNTMIDAQVADESSPENNRADVALKMISALYD